MRSRIVRLERVKASTLVRNPHNWRTHPGGQREVLRGALTEIGIAGALIARETPRGLELIDGHLRADELGDAEVPVLVVDVSEREAHTLSATLDPIAAMAEASRETLRGLTAGMEFESPALIAMAASLFGSDEPDPAGEGSRAFVMVGRRKQPADEAEIHKLWVAHEWYVARNGSDDGFVGWLLGRLGAA